MTRQKMQHSFGVHRSQAVLSSALLPNIHQDLTDQNLLQTFEHPLEMRSAAVYYQKAHAM